MKKQTIKIGNQELTPPKDFDFTNFNIEEVVNDYKLDCGCNIKITMKTDCCLDEWLNQGNKPEDLLTLKAFEGNENTTQEERSLKVTPFHVKEKLLDILNKFK